MRLIDADELLNRPRGIFNMRGDQIGECREVSFSDIEKAQTVDAEPVVHAHWEYDRWLGHVCSNCGATMPTETPVGFLSEKDNARCWRCGAKMDEVVNDETD